MLPAADATELLRRLQEVHARRVRSESQRQRLTDREIEILQEFALGRTTDEVAASLLISPNTVQTHVRSVLNKLGVRSKLEAILLALRSDWIRLPRD